MCNVHRSVWVSGKIEVATNGGEAKKRLSKRALRPVNAWAGAMRAAVTHIDEVIRETTDCLVTEGVCVRIIGLPRVA